MARLFNYLLACLAVILFSACTRLPEYARPKMLAADDTGETTTAIAYRQLTRNDFQAVSPAPEMVHHNAQVNAHLATRIRPTTATRLVITAGELYGARYFFGSVEHLGFEAVMIPEQSWWNPRIPKNRIDYVLEHEQIHFTITEIAARQLTDQSRDWAAQILVIKPTPEEVRAELARMINERINAAKKQSLQRNEQFDEDTSMIFNPRRQKWWLATVEGELRKGS